MGEKKESKNNDKVIIFLWINEYKSKFSKEILWENKKNGRLKATLNIKKKKKIKQLSK